MLLWREEVSPGKGDGSPRTPLLYAPKSRHEEPDEYGQKPLSHAAGNGHDEVVKILLRWQEVNPDNPGKWGRTSLLYATQCRQERVVKILLGQEEVSPDKLDDEGGTPFSFATWKWT